MPSFGLTTSTRQYARGYGTNILASSLVGTPNNIAGPISVNPPSTTYLGAKNVSGMNLAKLVMFGTGADNSQFYAHVYGWSQFGTVWMPNPICQVLCTLSTFVGILGNSYLTDLERVADAIALVEGDPTVKCVSDFPNVPASLLVDLEGAQFIDVRFTTTGLSSVATAFNYAYSAF